MKDRGVVISERKAELAEKAFYAWKLRLEVAKTAKEEEEDVAARRREKLRIESNITLPFPSDLKRRLVSVKYVYGKNRNNRVTSTFAPCYITYLCLYLRSFLHPKTTQ